MCCSARRCELADRPLALHDAGMKLRMNQTPKGVETDSERRNNREGEMINPITALSVSSIGIVLKWLPLSQSKLKAAG